MTAAEKLIVALDVPTYEAADALLNQLEEVVWVKIGSQLFTSQGPRIVELVKQKGKKVFLDLKFHDIPNTVASAAIEAVKMGVDMFDVHVLGGFEMMETTMKIIGVAAAELNRNRPLVLGVTILTSINEANLHDIFGVSDRSLSDEILLLAQLAEDAGLDGVVASAHEVKSIKAEVRGELIVVTPGVRPAAWADITDHARINSPKEAIINGSDYIVVGRPVLKADNPKQAALDIIAEIQAGLEATV